MKTTTNTIAKILARLAVAVAVLLPALAGAAPVPNPQSGDIFLGVRSAAGEDSYLVKIGTYSQLTSSQTFSLGNIGADLVAKYGANWHTRDDLFWGIFGRSGSVVTTLYASKARPDAGTQSVPWPLLTANARNSTASQILSVLESTGGYRGREATANSAVAAFQENTSEASSYNKQVATAGGTDFGSVSQWSSIEASFADGAANALLDIYRIGSGSVGYPGYFSISTSGEVSFVLVGLGDVYPELQASGTLSGFSALLGSASANKTITVSGSGLTADLTVTAPTKFEVSTDGTNFSPTVNLSPSSGTVGSTTIHVRIAASATAGAASGNVSVSSTGATTLNIAASGAVLAPTLSASGTLSAFGTGEGSASDAQTFTVSGSNLTADVTVTAPTGFEVSSDGTTYGTTATLTPVSNALSAVTVHVRIAASTAAGSIGGNVTVSSTNATTQNVAVTGTVTPPVSVTINGSLSAFAAWQGLASASQTVTVSGFGLSSSVVITAPAGYQVSTNGTLYAQSVTLNPTGGALAATNIFVRLAATAPAGAASGNLTASSTGAPTASSVLAGTVSPLVGVQGEGTISKPPVITKLANNKAFKLTAAPKPGHIFQQWLKNGVPFVPPQTNPTLQEIFKADEIATYEAVFVPNPYPAVVDSYNGLIGDGVIDSGFLGANGSVSLTTTATGNYAGTLFYAGVTYKLAGKFDGFKKSKATIVRKGASSLVLDLDFDTAAPDHKITGTLTVGASTLNLSALPRIFNVTKTSSNPHPKAGRRYTIALPSPDPALGHGFGLLTVLANGTATFAGILPDGVSFTTTVSSTDGDKGGVAGAWVFPVSFSPYGKVAGALIGEIYLAKVEPGTPATLTGDLGWVRPVVPKSLLFPSGLIANITAVGEFYQLQAGVSLVSGSGTPGNFTLSFDPDAEVLPSAVTQNGSWPATNLPLLTAPVQNGITLSFTGGTARFGGVFKPTPALAKGIAYTGITFTTPVTLPGDATPVRGVGLFLNGASTGRVEIK